MIVIDATFLLTSTPTSVPFPLTGDLLSFLALLFFEESFGLLDSVSELSFSWVVCDCTGCQLDEAVAVVRADFTVNRSRIRPSVSSTGLSSAKKKY